MSSPEVSAAREKEDRALRSLSLDERMVLTDLALALFLRRKDKESQSEENVHARTGTLLGKGINWKFLLADERFQAIIATLEARNAAGEVLSSVLVHRILAEQQPQPKAPDHITPQPAPIAPPAPVKQSRLHLLLALGLGTVLGGAIVDSCHNLPNASISSNK